jgi:hypothetical protein
MVRNQMTDFADFFVVATKVVTQKVVSSIALGELVLLVLTESHLKMEKQNRRTPSFGFSFSRINRGRFIGLKVETTLEPGPAGYELRSQSLLRLLDDDAENLKRVPWFSSV